MQDPIVSVVMTAYNGQAYIGEAIESVLAQSFGDFELLIIDDASSDNTIDIIKQYKDSRIRLIKNDQNIGISNTRNRGLEEARGRYIAPHDQDDISFPDRLEKEVEVLENNDNVVLVAGRVLDWEGSREVPWPKLPVPSPVGLAWRLFTKSMITHSIACIRAETLRKHSIDYRQTYHYAEDYDLYHRLSEVGSLVLLPDIIGKYRYHESNTSKTCGDEMERNGRRFLLDRYNEYLGENAVTITDMESIWRLAVKNMPASSHSELRLVGRVLSELVEAFRIKRKVEGEELELLLVDVSRVWWRIVEKTALFSGMRALSIYNEFDNLSKKPLSVTDYSYTALVSFLFPTYKKIKSFVK